VRSSGSFGGLAVHLPRSTQTRSLAVAANSIHPVAAHLRFPRTEVHVETVSATVTKSQAVELESRLIYTNGSPPTRLEHGYSNRLQADHGAR
jgi:hypothetical protein